MKRNNIKPLIIGHIVYPADKKILNIFQMETNHTEYIAEYDGMDECPYCHRGWNQHIIQKLKEGI